MDDAFASPHGKGDREPLPVIFYFVAGGVGDISACLVTHPLDTLKVRQQLSGELSAAPRSGSSMAALARTARGMHMQGGCSEFYRGISASVLRQSIFSSLRHGLFAVACTHMCVQATASAPAHRTATQQLPPHPSKFVPIETAALAATIVGGISALVANPTDVVLIRMQSDGHWPPRQRHEYRHAGQALLDIAHNEGLGRLWRGCGPTVLRASLVTLTQITTYHSTKRFLLKSAPLSWFPLGNNDSKLHLTAALASASAASLVTCPVDVVKTRIINMRKAEGGAHYKSSLDCVVQTVRTEGIRGLFKGLLPTFLRLGPHTVILWNVQEFALRSLASTRQS